MSSKPDNNFFQKLSASADCSVFKDQADYKHHFEDSLLKAKGVTLLVLILVSFVYQTINKNKTRSKTLLSSAEGKRRVAGECIFTAGMGVLSAIFVMTLRNGVGSLFKFSTFGNLLLIATILGLFCLAQEASGLDRYLAESETGKLSGLYYEIDKSQDPNEKEQPFENDPFLSSTGYLLVGTLIVFVLVYVVSMFKITACGYKSGLHNVADTKFAHTIGSSTQTFVIELIVVGLINCIPPFLSPSIRGEAITGKSSALALVTLLIASALQFMFQYSGIFH